MSSDNNSYEHRLKDAYQLILEEWNSYVENLTLYLVVWILFYTTLTYLLYIGYCRKNIGAYSGFGQFQRALIVTAHPDDECMFFGPTILELKKRRVDVYLLCLSDGNHDGQGNLRRNELWNSCNALGIQDDRIILSMDTRLPDDPNTHWDTELLAEIIGQQIGTYDFDTVITFDKGGVSGHSNHCNLFYALAYLSVNKQIPAVCRLYTLDSVNIIRKYWWYFDLPFSFLLSSIRFVIPWRQYNQLYVAMKCHSTQLLWFRYLYITFSRYMYINTLREFTILDFELELELEYLETR